MSLTICPHLGLSSDRTLVHTAPHGSHRCFAQQPPAAPDLNHQQTFCFGAYATCPHFIPVEELIAPVVTETAVAPGLPTWRWLYLGVVGVALLAVIVLYGRLLLAPGPAAATATPAAQVLISPTPTPSPIPSTDLAPTPASFARFVTPTPEPNGRVLMLAPQAGDVAWWTDAEARRGRVGDSFLYAGHVEGQTFLALARFPIERIPRGAPLRGGYLVLTGLNDERLDSTAEGDWTAQFLAAEAVSEPARADFQAVLNAPAAVTLLPRLNARDLAVGRENVWELDAAALAWLEERRLAGDSAVLLRLLGPDRGERSLFAWDSGSGPTTRGQPPLLVLNLGPAPATPPPLPTQPLIVATLTPTPANVLTVAVQALTATAVAATTGTYTPEPVNLATPTPTPENLATAQALGLIPPLVIPTFTPANPATATAQAFYATAVALTTGTFTPIPTQAVVATVVTPTPTPANAATALARLLVAQTQGTPTPLPFYVLVATATSTPFVVTATPRPANAATATEQAARATLAALTGTFTPLPAYAVTPTPTPTATAVPLLVFLPDDFFATPTPTPTSAPRSLPAALRGRILFFSDRPTPNLGERTNLWLLDPATGRLAYVTQSWVYAYAQQAELTTQTPEGELRLLVEPDTRRVLQVFVFVPRYGTRTQVSLLTGMSYDPAWAPDGNRIAFVSQEPGNDEIYVVARDSSNLTRLTTNTWEWDKHPSWSPDGRQIVFDSNRVTGRRQLWIMDATGSDQRPLLTSPYNDHSPIWVK